MKPEDVGAPPGAPNPDANKKRDRSAGSDSSAPGREDVTEGTSGKRRRLSKLEQTWMWANSVMNENENDEQGASKPGGSGQPPDTKSKGKTNEPGTGDEDKQQSGKMSDQESGDEVQKTAEGLENETSGGGGNDDEDGNEGTAAGERSGAEGEASDGSSEVVIIEESSADLAPMEEGSLNLNLSIITISGPSDPPAH